MTPQTYALLIIGLVTVIYTAVHYLPLVIKARLPDPKDQPRAVVLWRLISHVLLMWIPLGVAVGVDRLDLLGFKVTDWTITAGLLAVVFIILLPIIGSNAKNAKSWAFYPEIRATQWTSRLRGINAVSWTVYLLAYEFFFRGVFLFAIDAWLGQWPALMITTMAYVFVHLPKFPGEAIGTIPMGIIFGWVALNGGGFWAPFIAHTIIANFNDVMVLRARTSKPARSEG